MAISRQVRGSGRNETGLIGLFLACWASQWLLYSRTEICAEFRRIFIGMLLSGKGAVQWQRFVSILSTIGSNDLNLFRHNRKRVNASLHAAEQMRAVVGLLVPRFAIWPILAFFVLAIATSDFSRLEARQISFPRPDVETSISVSSTRITRWREGQYEVLHLAGGVNIQQQPISASANEAIVWVETPTEAAGKEHKVIVYLESGVVINVDRAGSEHHSTGASRDRIVDEKWLGRFFTRATVNLDQVTQPLGNDLPPAIFARAQTALAGGDPPFVQQTGFISPQQSVVVSPQTGAVQQITPTFQTPRIGAPPNRITPNSLQSGLRNQSQSSPFDIQITGRDPSVDLNTQTVPNPNNPHERVTTAVGGIRIVIDSPMIANAPQFQRDKDRKLYIVADNMVQWQTVMPDGSKRNQLYLEGDVVFAKGSRVIYSERMFYDVDAQRGTILKAEVITTVPNFRGTVRLKADVIQQYDENNLQAFGSAFTSSRLGVPRYWLQSESVGIFRSQVPSLDPDTLAQRVDPATGLHAMEDEFVVDGQRNRVYLAGVPVLAWPRIRTSLNDPTFYLDRIGVGNDRIFGFQLTTGWDMYQVLGLDRPDGEREWIGLLDYLSDRGVGYGSEYDYGMDSLFGVRGKVKGQYRSWFIRDDGLDNLGLDRRSLVPEEKNRGRIWAQHRQDLGPGRTIRAELGYISDRNFLEQYYEREWDTRKDQTTGLWFERNFGTQSNHLTLDLQVNDFFTQTAGVRFENFVLGQPLFNNRAIWHSHSQGGYVRMHQANAPLSPSELATFRPLAWESDVDGLEFGTRHELDFPNQIGPVKVVPYLLGDVNYWQQALDGNDLTRVYGQAGIRASLPLWRVDPSIQSVLWNVNGLAHKLIFDVDAFYADASQDLDELALYNPLDDDSQEAFRRRYASNTFGVPPGSFIPILYDERYFAFRSGMQSNVAAASSEIADDLTAIKFGIRQRWQTKRGMPGRERIIDWITLDMQTILYPDANRDNNGADFGMFDYDFRWHIGDRFSFVSDGYFDFFSQGLRTASFGTNVSRPEVGNVYVGYRMIEGPISSNILSAALTYRMSDKWGVKAGGQVDFGQTGTIGESLNFVYIGESFLWQFGFNYDVSRDNVGVQFGFEPRFVSRPRLFRPGGVAIRPAGSRWLE